MLQNDPSDKVPQKERELYYKRIIDMKRFINQRLGNLWSDLHSWVYEGNGKAEGASFKSIEEAGKTNPITQAKWELGEMIRLAAIHIRGEFEREDF